MSPLRSGAIALVALAFVGCGGGKGKEPPPPAFPSALGTRLANESDSVARALQAGDDCAALQSAEQLRDDAIAAINGGRVPAPLQEPLLATVHDLVAGIRCAPPPEKEHGKGRGKHKKKHGGDGD